MLNATLTAARRLCAGKTCRCQCQEDRAAHHRIDDGQDGHDCLHHLVKAGVHCEVSQQSGRPVSAGRPCLHSIWLYSGAHWLRVGTLPLSWMARA